jgi:hypothetical protein
LHPAAALTHGLLDALHQAFGGLRV